MTGFTLQAHLHRHQYPTALGFPMGVSLKKLLIKSQAFFVHRRAQQSTIVTILSRNAKTVPTVQK